MQQLGDCFYNIVLDGARVVDVGLVRALIGDLGGVGWHVKRAEGFP